MTKILLVDDDVELINMIKEQLFILNSYWQSTSKNS
jgi:CheY-like chemotaxis protein